MRISPGTGIATIALFVSLGGTGYAASQYVVSSTRDIKDNAIRSADIRNGSVGVRDLSKAAKRTLGTSSKARIASVVEEVITDPQYGISITVKGEKGADGTDGAAGPQGTQGAAGAQGTPGEPGIASIQRVNGASENLQPGESDTDVAAQCPAGTKAISGGLMSSQARVDARELEPTAGGDGFRAWVTNTNTDPAADATVYVWVLCAVVG